MAERGLNSRASTDSGSVLFDRHFPWFDKSHYSYKRENPEVSENP